MLHMNAVGSTPYPQKNKKNKKRKKSGLYSKLRFAECIFWVYQVEIKAFFYGNKFMPKLGPSVFLLLRKQLRKFVSSKL